ncbi:hypothetical protein ACFYPC_34350 [Streptomyces sp. NPDC005808]|uniref:hypothetical protein n=1 Tax=Streptomyces sp. NPDC005808 TaxID=3364734 RepID=UPI0036A0F473
MFGRPPPDSFYEADPDDEDGRWYFLRSQRTLASSDYDEDDPTADADEPYG